MSTPLFLRIKNEGPVLSKNHANYLNKIEAKTIVKSLSNVKVAKLIKTFRDANELTVSDIHPNYLLKASRGSGFCLDLAGKSLASVHRKINEWKPILARKQLPIEFLIEEKLDDAVYGITSSAVDYKFFCFHGKPVFFLCRHGENRNFYDLQYNPLKLESVAELPHIDLNPMIKIAEELSAPFPFVRIDLYNCKDGVYFGEFTFHCREGKQEFNMDLEIQFGKLW